MSWWKKLFGRKDKDPQPKDHSDQKPESNVSSGAFSQHEDVVEKDEKVQTKKQVDRPRLYHGAKTSPPSRVKSGPWQKQPLFISSTFADMMAERDHLRDFVFPALAERLRARRCHLEPVDLRWGVETITLEEQEQKELLVLKVCLDEINRCKPFMIGLLGDRYGWIPPAERMQEAIDEKGFQTDISSKSVTALEIEFGVLANPEQQQWSFFYFRDPLPYDQMDPQTAAAYSDKYNTEPWAPQAVQHLAELKKKISSQLGLNRVKPYAAQWNSATHRVVGLESWGNQVLEDLWSELDSQTARFARQPSSWQDQERQYLEVFVEERSMGFTGREQFIDTLISLALSAKGEAQWGACVAAGPGTGKSALFAKLIRKLEQEDCLLLSHAAGISVRSNNLDALLRRWIQELAFFLDLPEEEPSRQLTSLEEKQTLFAELLSRASQQTRVVCLIDALNQMERVPAVRHMTWLPELWPENARALFTAIPGQESKTLSQKNGVKLLELRPLSAADATAIIRAVCDRHHKTMHPDIGHILVEKKTKDKKLAAGNPLWLQMAVEELLLLDENDFTRMHQFSGSADQKLHQLLCGVATQLPVSIEEMYEYLFTRAARKFGKDWLELLIHLMAVSRWGLREEDLHRLMLTSGREWNDLSFASLRRYLRAHLVQKGEHGLWDFNHAQVRISLERKFSAEPLEKKQKHQLLADYFSRLESDDPLRQTEYMYHLIGSDQKGKAAHYYGSDFLTQQEKAGSTRILADAVLQDMERSPNPGLQWTLSLLSLEEIEEKDLRRLINRYQFDLYKTLADYAHVQLRIKLINKTKEVCEEMRQRAPDSAEYARDMVVSYYKLANFYEQEGASVRCQEYYQLCKQAIVSMKKRGMYIDPPLENLLKQLGG